jgi:hypothetical protein
MANEITVDELSLLMHALEREYAKSQDLFRNNEGSLSFYPKGVGQAPHVYVSVSQSDRIFVSLTSRNGVSLYRPSFLWKRDRKTFDNALDIYNKIMGIHGISNMEKTICDAVPAAKEIIAEKALVGDHGN